MKHIIFFISILILIQGVDNMCEKRGKCMVSSMSRTLLDSLQGNWLCLKDTTVTVIINGRSFIENTNDDIFISSRAYKMYFSDTIIDRFHEFIFDEISLDTNKLSGNYLVNVSLQNNSVECFKIVCVTDTVFSISDVWARRSNTNFKRIN
ncbi:MAG: hypothetical protein KF781_10325 [Chitinophagaceae bacterium]|nr:hypothetical protein [Chitinophagaceae bacterium]MCW5904915.1 hypothetical protein [Chitinophagaceae bacterium]